MTILFICTYRDIRINRPVVVSNVMNAAKDYASVSEITTHYELLVNYDKNLTTALVVTLFYLHTLGALFSFLF